MGLSVSAIYKQHSRFCHIVLHLVLLMQELARRCDTLIRLVEKENEEVEAAEQAEKKKSSKKTSGSRATDSSGGAAGTSTKVRALATLCTYPRMHTPGLHSIKILGLETAPQASCGPEAWVLLCMSWYASNLPQCRPVTGDQLL